MPYITQGDRDRLKDGIDILVDTITHRGAMAGDLNYLFTRLAQAYITRYGMRYANLNAVIGALESAKLEFYRRTVVPYEDRKIEENGDV
jgi:hypothetical protein